jgi:hypothetical protein
LLRRDGEMRGNVPLSLTLLMSKSTTCTSAAISVGKVADSLSQRQVSVKSLSDVEPGVRQIDFHKIH